MTRKQKRNIEKRRKNRLQQKPKKLIIRRRLREMVKEINRAQSPQDGSYDVSRLLQDHLRHVETCLRYGYRVTQGALSRKEAP